MLDRRAGVLLALLLSSITTIAMRELIAIQDVDAAARPVLFYGERARYEPRSIDASKITTRNGGPPFDETVYRARELRWSGWGSSRAVGRGRLTYCVTGYTPCSTRRGTVTVSTIWKNGCGDISYRAYRYVRWNFPGHPSPRVESMPRC